MMKKAEITVRSMTVEDIPGVVEIENHCFSTPWTRHAFRMELKNKLAVYLVAEHREKVAAYAGMWLIVDEAHITNVAVHPAFRSLGLGRRILEAMVAEARARNILRMTLEVRKSNDTAIQLYREKGFLIAGIRPGYYVDNGEDAIIMWKEL